MSSLSTGSSLSGPNSALMGQYGTEYSNALNLNNSNYQNILSQYGQSLGNVQGQVGKVAAGYGQLSQQVQGTIAGIGKSQSQAIQDTYAQQAGAMNQQLANRGLGNTTVVGSMQRGLTLDSQKAQIALANQIAQLTAGYQAQLGSAGLSAGLTGAGLAANQGNSLVGALSSYKTPYPSWPPNSSQSSSHGQSLASPYVNGGRGGMPGLGGFDQSQPPNPYFNPNVAPPNLYGSGLPGMYGNAPSSVGWQAPQQAVSLDQLSGNYSSGGPDAGADYGNNAGLDESMDYSG